MNDKALKKTDVYALINEITTAEQEMNLKVTNKSVKELMDLYQRAIEYYSALDNNAYEDFLNRMTGLFKREDIQVALAQPEEEKTEEPAEDSKGEEPESTSINAENTTS